MNSYPFDFYHSVDQILVNKISCKISATECFVVLLSHYFYSVSPLSRLLSRECAIAVEIESHHIRRTQLLLYQILLDALIDELRQA